jgi:hypothetical protein
VQPHPFRPLDAVLGLALIAVGVLVSVFGFENLDEDNLFVWLAIAAGVVGLSLLPWPHRRTPVPHAEPAAAVLADAADDDRSPLPDESSPDG